MKSMNEYLVGEPILVTMNTGVNLTILTDAYFISPNIAQPSIVSENFVNFVTIISNFISTRKCIRQKFANLEKIARNQTNCALISIQNQLVKNVKRKRILIFHLTLIWIPLKRNYAKSQPNMIQNTVYFTIKKMTGEGVKKNIIILSIYVKI